MGASSQTLKYKEPTRLNYPTQELSGQRGNDLYFLDSFLYVFSVLRIRCSMSFLVNEVMMHKCPVF